MQSTYPTLTLGLVIEKNGILTNVIHWERNPRSLQEDENPCRKTGTAVLNEIPYLRLMLSGTSSTSHVRPDRKTGQPTEPQQIIKHFYFKPLIFGDACYAAKANRYKYIPI